MAGRIRRIPLAVCLILIGLIVSGSDIETLSSWLPSGVALGIALTAGCTFSLRHQPELLPIAIGTIGSLSALKGGLRQTYPAILPGTITGSILIAIVTWLWFKSMVKQPAAA